MNTCDEDDIIVSSGIIKWSLPETQVNRKKKKEKKKKKKKKKARWQPSPLPLTLKAYPIYLPHPGSGGIFSAKIWPQRMIPQLAAAIPGGRNKPFSGPDKSLRVLGGNHPPPVD